MIIAGVDSDNTPRPILVDEHGHLIVVIRNDDGAIRKNVTLANTDETTVWDPTTGKKFVITDMMIYADNIAVVTWRDDTDGDTIMVHTIMRNAGHGHHFSTPIVSDTADNILTAQTTASNVYITVLGYEL